MQKIVFLLIGWCCCMHAATQPNIVQAEYYIDTDPGFGNALGIPVSNVVNIIDNTFPVTVSSLSQGLHTVFIRSKNAAGNWSLTNPLLFYKPAAPGAAANIIKAEYYFDTDPGFGLAQDIPLMAGPDVPNISFDPTVNSLPVGIHILFIRSKDAAGKWSVTNQLVFYKKSPASAIPDITKAEWYFDNDPGFGFATAIPITVAPDLQNISFNANINLLAVGIHILFIRSQDATGKWSVTNQLVYYKKDTTPLSNIAKAEYYFDNDPGFGFATAIPVTATIDLQNINFVPNIQPLTVGLHILFLRSCNAFGKWSVTNQLVCYKPAPAGSGVTAIEYYYDSEPGFGEGIPIAINETNNLADYLAPVNITGLPSGDHKLFMRSKTSNGWSITNVYPFTVTATAPTPFININSITSKTNCAWNNFRISFHATGNYLPNNKFTVQLSDAAGSGSFTSPITIGQITAQRSSIINCQMPAHVGYGDMYRLRVISSNTVVTGILSLDSITIHDRPELGNDTTIFIICAGETLNLLPLYNTAGLITN